MAQRTLNPRGDWVGLIEAIHAPASSDDAWADGIIDSARSLFPRAAHLMTYAMQYGPARQLTGLLFSRPTHNPMMTSFREVTGAAGEAWIASHFAGPVLTAADAMRDVSPAIAERVTDAHEKLGYRESLGIIAHPQPGVVMGVGVVFDEPIDLTRTDREQLTRIAFHLEAGHRLRAADAAVVAIIGAKGDVTASRLEPQVARIKQARSRGARTTPEGTELWTALVEGRLSIVPRDGRYLVLDNPTPTYWLRALTARETAVLALAARGCSSKQIRYALGVSPSLVSTALRSAAAKVGLLKRTELVRLAALLMRDGKTLLNDEDLTRAEQEVLALLERGLDNRQIAAIRMRSVRTIANQVASLLRKTGAASRRQLVARTA